MILSEFAPATLPRIRIDTVFLLHQVATLVQVRRRRRTWNEFGEKLFHDFEESPPATRRSASRVPPTDAFGDTSWSIAKGLVHAVLTTEDPMYDGIRKRLGNLQDPSTARLWSTLSLWLAGMLGISTSVTGPLVAVMLYGVAEAKGDWEVLGNPQIN